MKFPRLWPPGESRSVVAENYTIFVSVMLTYTGFSSSFPFIAVFLNQVKNVPLDQVGVIYLISGFLGIAGQIAGGRLSDYLGTRTITVLGLSGSVIFYALLALFVVDNSPVYLYAVVYPALNLMNNFSQLALSSHIADRSTEKMASGMSLLYVGLNLGFTIGPISGGYLIAYYGYASIFIFGAISTLASAIVAVVGLKTNPRYALRAEGKSPGRKVKLRSGLLPFFFLVAASWLAIGYQAIPLSVFESTFLSLSSIEIGAILTTNGLLITLFQMQISKAIGVERKMRLMPIAIGSGIMAAGFLILAEAKTFVPIEIAVTLSTIGEMMVAVPTQVIVTMFSSEHNRGTYQGYYFAFSRVGISFSSFIGPLVFSIFFFNASIGWYIIAVVSLATGVAYSVLSPRLERSYSEVTAEKAGAA